MISMRANILILIFAFALTQSATAKDTAEVKLLSSVVITSNTVRLSDIADIFNCDKPVAKKLASIVIENDAFDGVQITGREIKIALQKTGINCKVNGSRICTITMNEKEVKEKRVSITKDIKSLLRTELAEAKNLNTKDLELKIYGLNSSFEKLLKQDNTYARLRGEIQGACPGTLEVVVECVRNSSVIKSQNIRMSVRVKRPALFPIREIKRGEIISAADVGWQDYWYNERDNELVNDSSLVVGSQATSTLRVNTPLKAKMVEPAVLVKRNDIVMVVANTGGFAMRLRAKALQNGRLGENIQVENLTSRGKFVATVAGFGKMTLDSEGKN